MHTFETKIQELKTSVLTGVARLTWEDKLQTGILDVPEKIFRWNLCRAGRFSFIWRLCGCSWNRNANVCLFRERGILRLRRSERLQKALIGRSMGVFWNVFAGSGYMN